MASHPSRGDGGNYQPETEQGSPGPSGSEAELRHLLFSLGPPMGLFDLEGNLVFMNRAGAALWQVQPQDLAGSHLRDLFPARGEEYLERLLQTARTGQPADYEDLLDLPVGQRWFRSTYLPIRDPQGRLYRVQVTGFDITEQKETESELNRAQELYHLLAQNAADVIWRTDEQGRFTYYSPSVQNLLGYTPEEICRLTLKDILSPDSLARVEEKARQRMEAEARGEGDDISRIWEVQHIHRDGHLVWVETTTSTLRHPDGGFAGVMGVTRGIEERKRAEIAIRESRERFSLFLEHFPGAAFLREAEGKLIYANQRYCQAVGLETSQILGRHYRDYVSPAMAEVIAEGDRQVLASGETLEREDEVPGLEGTQNFVSFKFQVPRQDARPLIGGLVLDVTDRKQEQRRLAQSEALYRALFENANDAIFVADPRDGMLTDCNRAAEELLGRSRAEIVGQHHSFLHPPEEEDLCRAGFQNAVQGGIREITPAEVLHRDGRRIPVEISAGGVIQAGDRPVHIALFRDISARMEAEAEKATLEAQLHQSQKMEALGTLAGGIAHDFNNILGAIMGYAELAAKGLERDNPAQASLNSIQGAAGRAKALIRQILTFSRKGDTRREPVEVDQRLDGILQIVGRTIPAMIEVITDLGAGGVCIKADPLQIDQAVLNLCSNAADAMPEGGRLRVSSRRGWVSGETCRLCGQGFSGDMVEIRVEDTGQGISPEIMAKIFDPFFTTKGVGRGTGLGLALVYGMVVKHGGHLVCQSREGEGSRFSLYFPVHAGPPAPREEVPVQLGDLAGRGELILVVDDDADIRRIATDYLETTGYRNLQAASGEEALELYGSRGGEIAAVVLDIGMPGMGGKACLVELMKLDPEVKVIIASGYLQDHDAERLRELGAAAMVGKPYRGQDLLAALKRLISRD